MTGPTGTSEGVPTSAQGPEDCVNSAQDSYCGILCKLTGGPTFTAEALLFVWQIDLAAKTSPSFGAAYEV